MLSSLLKSTLVFWEDDNCTRSEITILATSNAGLVAWAICITHGLPDLTSTIASILAAFACSFLPLLSIPFIILLGYRYAQDDTALRFSRSLMLTFFISLIFYAANIFRPISLVSGPVTQKLPLLDLKLETYLIFLAAFYAIIGSALMLRWTFSKYKITGQSLNPKSVYASFVLATIINGAMIYGFVLDKNILAALKKCFVSP